MEDKLAKCRYYKGEEKCPYIDPALVLWWSLEEKSIEEQDEVDGDLLTPTMTRYIYGPSLREYYTLSHGRSA